MKPLQITQLNNNTHNIRMGPDQTPITPTIKLVKN